MAKPNVNSRSKIYTKTGDRGTTRLIGGTEISKNNSRLEAYGTVDELNSFVGWVLASLNSSSWEQNIAQKLAQIQNDLFVVGSLLACEKKDIALTLPHLNPSSISDLEQGMDEMQETLPPLKEFILPGGSTLSAQMHILRTITRRAERRFTAITDFVEQKETLGIYLNRLNDWFFVTARFCSFQLGTKETVWQKK